MSSDASLQPTKYVITTPLRDAARQAGRQELLQVCLVVLGLMAIFTASIAFLAS